MGQNSTKHSDVYHINILPGLKVKGKSLSSSVYLLLLLVPLPGHLGLVSERGDLDLQQLREGLK